ncbi:hypothetical protein MATL_G00045840 [Megalops atlanticus]|uniref:Uncharacterized protein n=1 Tax=Megalops atlanticus TaxID=7932 RepID=A0A9D3QF53_MEGAT|nr:hypothetical protein MATL_G00045840 [Megalops atlanticus]
MSGMEFQKETLDPLDSAPTGTTSYGENIEGTWGGRTALWASTRRTHGRTHSPQYRQPAGHKDSRRESEVGPRQREWVELWTLALQRGT